MVDLVVTWKRQRLFWILCLQTDAGDTYGVISWGIDVGGKYCGGEEGMVSTKAGLGGGCLVVGRAGTEEVGGMGGATELQDYTNRRRQERHRW